MEMMDEHERFLNGNLMRELLRVAILASETGDYLLEKEGSDE